MVLHMPDALLTSPQVAQKIGVSVRTVHRLVMAERLRIAQRLEGPNGAFLFEPGEVDAYLARQRDAAAGAA